MDPDYYKVERKRFVNGIPEQFSPPDVPVRKLDEIPDDSVIHHLICAKDQRIAQSALESLEESTPIYCVNCRGNFAASTFTNPSTKKALA